MLKQLAPRDTMGHFWGLGGQQFKSLGKLPNSWTIRHHIWHTIADRSENRYKLNKIDPMRYQGEDFRGQHFKSGECHDLQSKK